MSGDLSAPHTIRRVIIFGNGDLPPAAQIHANLQTDDYYIAADGGAEVLIALGRSPAVIIGDLDSLSAETAARLRQNGSLVIACESQEENDLAKALNWVLERRPAQIILIGFYGAREDQSLATLQLAARYCKIIPIIILAPLSEITVLQPGQYTLTSHSGQIISLFGFPAATEITTHNLKYPLHRESLTEGSRGLSNVATASTFGLHFETGRLVVFKNY